MAEKRTTRQTVSTEAELTLVQERLAAKEAQLKDQAVAIQRESARLQEQSKQIRQEQENLEKSRREEIPALEQIMVDWRAEINPLKDAVGQILQLQSRLDDLQKRSREPSIRMEGDIDSQDPAVVEALERPVAATRPENPLALRLKDALESVPRYDGYRIPIYQFTRACERARDMISPASEAALVNLIINKLQGHAFQAVEDTDISTTRALSTSSSDSEDHTEPPLARVRNPDTTQPPTLRNRPKERVRNPATTPRRITKDGNSDGTTLPEALQREETPLEEEENRNSPPHDDSDTES
ncbi:hypothetical protein KPH14_010911, partial [Odynerus spinipes]